MSLTLQLFRSVAFLRTSMPTTLRFTARARRLTFTLFRWKFLSVSTTSPAGWMKCNRLQLNPGKTELLWCSTDRRSTCPSTCGGIDYRLLPWRLALPLPVSTVRDLGIFVDCDLVMRTHVCRTVTYWFAMLRQLRSIRYQSMSLRQSSSDSSPVWTMVTVRWLVFRSTFNDASSRSRTQPLV